MLFPQPRQNELTRILLRLEAGTFLLVIKVHCNTTPFSKLRAADPPALCLMTADLFAQNGCIPNRKKAEAYTEGLTRTAFVLVLAGPSKPLGVVLFKSPQPGYRMLGKTGPGLDAAAAMSAEPGSFLPPGVLMRRFHRNLHETYSSPSAASMRYIDC